MADRAPIPNRLQSRTSLLPTLPLKRTRAAWSASRAAHRGARALPSLALALTLAIAVLGCASASRTGYDQARSPNAVAVGSPLVLASEGLVAASGRGSLTRALPASPWAASFNLDLAPDSAVQIVFGSDAAPMLLEVGSGGSPILSALGHSYPLSAQHGWLVAAGAHFEATPTALAVNGVTLPAHATSRGSLSLRVLRGSAQVRWLILSSAVDRASLLLHRLAELNSRLSPRQFPVGADTGNVIHQDPRSWTSGFWPGALWQAAALESQGGMFAQRALQATIAHFGQERSDTHDVGFIYGESSLAAWQALCQGAAGNGALCARLRNSALAAADELRALAASNPVAGTIPTDARSPQADTIIDSMMNIAILPWATRVTGNPAYARLAAHHAHVVAQELVRPDGSTAQSVHFDRASGKVLLIHTHQGLSNNSTWSRGEGWGLYGFAQAAADLHDRQLLAVAEKIASYVAGHLPADGIPRWDYDAPSGAPVDVSAGVITAAGFLHLAAACRSLDAACGQSGRWVSLSRKMLGAALQRADDNPPLGYLGSQVLNERSPGCWCNGGELMFGLTYALEAAKLERTVG